MRDFLETALDAIRTNRLRSVLTILIIAAGITSLVGIQTAIEILSRELSDSFSRMGAARITVTAAEKAPPLTVSQARSFTTVVCSGGDIAASISILVDALARASSEGKTTDPVITLTASDRQWLQCSGNTLAAGRNFTRKEIKEGAAVCLIGASIAARTAGTGKDAIGGEISFGRGTYRIIGIIEKRGAGFSPGAGCEAVIPLANATGQLIGDESSCTVTLLAAESGAGSARETARIAMRKTRRLPPDASDDFEIKSGDSLGDTLSSLESKLSAAALATGLITLLGAAAGLMNIMLVSVRERRSEIGLRKALGARKEMIAGQFIFEAFFICQIGGLCGAALGAAAGNIVALILGGSFLIPVKWFALALLVCTAVSLLSGFLPARRAAAMDPIEALRQT